MTRKKLHFLPRSRRVSQNGSTPLAASSPYQLLIWCISLLPCSDLSLAKCRDNTDPSAKFQTRTAAHSVISNQFVLFFFLMQEKEIFFLSRTCHIIENGRTPSRNCGNHFLPYSKENWSKWRLWKHIKATSGEQCVALVEMEAHKRHFDRKDDRNNDNNDNNNVSNYALKGRLLLFFNNICLVAAFGSDPVWSIFLSQTSGMRQASRKLHRETLHQRN